VDGYKRHVLHDLDTGLIRAVGITPANVPEASVTKEIDADLKLQRVRLTELHIDRGYLSSHFVRERSDELEIYCKAWRVRGGKRFSKQAFTLDWDRQIICCPAEQEMPFVPGGVVHFPKDTCAQCPKISPMHDQHERTQRQYSPRRSQAIRVARAAANPTRASPTA
jgi:hypothetical protein